jgi:hypothetical protein
LLPIDDNNREGSGRSTFGAVLKAASNLPLHYARDRFADVNAGQVLDVKPLGLSILGVS